MKIKVKTNCKKEIELKVGDRIQILNQGVQYIIFSIIEDKIIGIPFYSKITFCGSASVVTLAQEYLEELGVELIEEGKEIKEENWRPKKGEEYWYIDSYGKIIDWEWSDSCKDEWRLKTHNVFKTEKEAQAYYNKIMGEEE